MQSETDDVLFRVLSWGGVNVDLWPHDYKAAPPPKAQPFYPSL